MAGVNPSVRRVVFTLNNYTDESINMLRTLFTNNLAKYIIYGKEIAPGTGTRHLQGYMSLVKKTRLRTIYQQLPGN